MSRDGVREAKAKLSVAEPGKGCGGQQAFHRYIGCKRKIRENVGLLLNGTEVLMTKDMEKAEVLHVFSVLVSTGKTSLWELQAPEASGKG